MRRPILAVIPTIVLMAAVPFAVPSFAQNSDFNLNMHANSHATAKDIGLPVYPGATPFKDKDSDSSSADLGFVWFFTPWIVSPHLTGSSRRSGSVCYVAPVMICPREVASG